MTIQETPGSASAGEGSATSAAIESIRFEHFPDGFAVGVNAPRLSWLVVAPGDWQQSAYEIEFHNPAGERLATTGRVESSESALVEWPFVPLQSREQAQIRVQAWDANGQTTGWSKLVPLEATLLEAGDWTASFVTPTGQGDTGKEAPSPFLRREFDVKAGVSQARLYITALGLYEAHLNGAVVGDHTLAPGWSSFNNRLRFQTFDVTGQLQEGKNALGAILGDGWYKGKMGFGGGRMNIYGDKLALLAQLEIKYADGTTQSVVSGEDWQTATGPILVSNIYDGEDYDARLEKDGWATVGYDTGSWGSVEKIEWDLTKLVTPPGPPVRRMELVPAVEITTSPAGKTLVDFGQNVVGRIRLTVQGEAGQTITLRHAEVLENGELGTRPLRHATQTDHYILRGNGVEIYEPRFTFHGFRYAEISGWPGELTTENLTAVICHSDMERTGWFETSDDLINRLHENVVWGMRGNFVDVPTDCPQRDERLGWTGDIEVFSPTASYLFNSAGFLTNWLADLAADQYDNGIVPFVIPNIMQEVLPPMAAWSDAAVIVPWVLYQRFGDKSILEIQFNSMKAWVDHLDRLTGDRRLWDQGFQFADWLDPDAPPDKPAQAKTSPATVATAYFAHSATLLAKIAGVLGKTEEEAHYAAVAAQVRQAFNDEYVTANGRIISDATTVYSMALEFALLPEARQRDYAGKRLAELARESGYHISTGFVGTPLICDALCNAGEYEAAYRLLTQRENPSWLYPVTMGATTIWERWDSMLPNGQINPGEMTSFNHYALGAVADWLHRTVGGLAPAAPGYKKLTIQPVPGGGLTSARARHITPYGLAESAWKIEGGQFVLDVTVPANSTATVILPGQSGESSEVGAGRHHWAVPFASSVKALGPFTLESKLDDVTDTPEVLALVVNTLRQFVPDFARQLEDGMTGTKGMSLRDVIFILPNSTPVVEALERDLAEFNKRYETATA